MKKLSIFLTTLLSTVVLNAKTLYFVPDLWETGGAKFAAYFYSSTNGSNYVWSEFLSTDETDAFTYKVDVPDGKDIVIFVRLSNTCTSPNWTDKWNQTGDLTITETNDCYTITAWGSGKSQGVWSLYTAPKNVTAYFVNKDAWSKVYAYVYAAKNGHFATKWSGEELTTTEDVVKYPVYSYTFSSSFGTIIFNDGGTNKTTDLTVDATKPYYYDGTWYTSLDEIPDICVPEYGIMVGEEFKAFTANTEKEGEYMLTGVSLKNGTTFTLYNSCTKATWTVTPKEGSTEKVTIADEKYVAGADGYYDFYYTPSIAGDALYIGYTGTTPTSVVTVTTLDRNAPMYNILGQQVDATYRGVVFQNGTKFLLQ